MKTRTAQGLAAAMVASTLQLLPGAATQAQPANAPPVAGLQPDRRPPGAPVLRAAQADSATKERRLKGVSQPWPGNVARIAEQGAWYSPMFAPGMPGRYDLRQLHPAATRP